MTTPVQVQPGWPAKPGSEIIDFLAIRNAIPTPEPTARDDLPGDDLPGDAVVLAFPSPAWRQLPNQGAAAIAADLSAACARLVESFATLQHAMTELKDSCRALDANTGPMRDQAGAVLMGIAALASSSERFQSQLDATIDAAFC
jgi:hypothetical protein